MSFDFVIALQEPGRISISGHIGFDNAAQLFAQRWELGEGGATIQVDLSGLHNCDSATLALLIAWAAHAHRHQGKLHYLKIPPELGALASLCEVEELLGLIPPSSHL